MTRIIVDFPDLDPATSADLMGALQEQWQEDPRMPNGVSVNVDWAHYFSESVRSPHDDLDGQPRFTDRWIVAGYGSLADAVSRHTNR